MTKFLVWMFTLRYLALLAVIAPIFGAILMFLLGSLDTINAYLIFFGRKEVEGAVDAGEAAMIKLVASVDHFLFGTILMIFAIGLYFLFFQSDHQDGAKGKSQIPSWKRVSNLEGMDLMLMKVIIMLLTVSFLEFILTAGMGTLNWPILVVPLTIIALAAALRWMQPGSEKSGDSVSALKPASLTGSKASETAYLDQLERLAALRAQGVLTDGEFQVRKNMILNA